MGGSSGEPASNYGRGLSDPFCPGEVILPSVEFRDRIKKEKEIGRKEDSVSISTGYGRIPNF